MCNATIKSSEHHQLKITDRIIWSFCPIKIIKGPGNNLPSSRCVKNELEMLNISCNNIWPNFIWIIPEVLLICISCCPVIRECSWNPDRKKKSSKTNERILVMSIWCHRFWSLCIHLKQENLSILRMKYFSLNKQDHSLFYIEGCNMVKVIGRKAF